MPTAQPAPWFDAHLDLAYLAEKGRDMHAPLDDCRGPLQPASVTLPSLRDGDVRACLGTIFTEGVQDPTAHDAETGAHVYALGDAEGAYRAGMRQLKLYNAWAGAGVIELMPCKPQDSSPAAFNNASSSLSPAGRVASSGAPSSSSPSSLSPLGRGRGEGSSSSSSSSSSLPSSLSPPGERAGVRGSSSPSPLRLGVLVECADPIPSPDELPEWDEQGVVAIGMAWWHESRYAGGNGTDNLGLTDLGRALIPAMDALAVVHDLSHLSQRATDELLTLTDAPVIASHSNCRSLLGGEANPQHLRHLSDDTIREIARRGGVIGLNLIRNFIRTGLDRNNPSDRPSADDAVAHVEHICELVGDRRCVGLGSDMDGGITANDLPAAINTPSDLTKLTDALRARGWNADDLAAFRYDNWIRFWGVKSDHLEQA